MKAKSKLLPKQKKTKPVKKGQKKSPKSEVSKQDEVIAAMSVDQFLASGLDSEEDSDEITMPLKSREQGKVPPNQNEMGSAGKGSSKLDGEESTSDEEGDEEDFQRSIHNLKDSDPEFYKFLQENDKDVLQMEDEDEIEEEEDGQGESDESEDEAGGRTGLSLAQIGRWEAALAGTQARSALKEVTAAFRSAVQRVSGAGAEPGAAIDDPTVFNALVRLCLNEVPRTAGRVLQLESADKDPTRSKRWVQVKGPLKRFLTDVIQLLTSAGSAAMQRSLLRHLLAMTPYLAAEPRLCTSLVGRLVALWSSGEEEVRVLAFVNMYRLVRRNQATLLDTVLMKAYLAYVKNCAFTSASSWPAIHLMRRSLVELYCIDPTVSYQRAFLYIRQLAIHLRNAKLDKKKFQVVYNWQYVHCLLLWSALIGEDRSEELRLLLYPLTQIMLGAANLITTARHYPLRLHITRALTQLSTATNTFIPVLPLLLQVLHQTDFNRRPTRVSMRPLDLSCMLRFSEAELKENGFRDGVLDAVLAGLVEYLHVECCSLAFPELVVMARLQLKEFLTKCKVRAYNQKVKELRDKVVANSEHLERLRQTLPFELSDLEAVRRWELERRAEGTPFTAYYQAWRARQQQKSAARPGKDAKISVRTAAGDVESDEADDDELQPFNDSDEEAADGDEPEDSGEEAADEDQPEDSDEERGATAPSDLQWLQSESDEVEDEGDTLEPLKPQNKKQKPMSAKKRKLAQSKSRKMAKVR